ncbi:MAG: hypothetical protein LBK57_10755 [Clostridiales Family XIII bacterium]|jgi:hypothetical protein|nr:hypothetical protein [Clostridiales Family XIII bacterium]
MDEFCICFSLAELYGSALSRLKTACRFDPAKEMHARMLDDALAAHADFARGAELAAAARFFEPSAPQGTSLTVSGVAFSCAAFAQLDERNLTGIIAYAVTLRRDAAPRRDTGRLFYEDVWGNAYIEAALDALRTELAARADGVLSDSFGPGYYGMAPAEMKKLARVLDFGKIGAEVLENGIIRPQKSCAGILFTVRNAALMPAALCRDCAGDRAVCALCGRSR